jgi:glycosyltransferase involved in cell wall biosynthesis
MEDGMNLLALVDSPDHVCCRYRIQAFGPALQQAGWTLTCQSLTGHVFARTLRLRSASLFDAVILQRKLLPMWQLRLLRRRARRLVFDFDDAVLYRDSNDPRGPKSARRLKRFTETVRVVDTIVAGNDYLADCALRAGAEAARVHVIPTCVDPGLYPVAGHHDGSAPLDLVWIGSSSTLRSLEQLPDMWRALARALPSLRLRIICDRFPREFPLPVVPVPWDQRAEARQIASASVGVSWLPDDLWSRGKCGLKILQYQAAGLPVIANPVGCQNEMIQTGVTGVLASTPAEWVDAVKLLAYDAYLRRRMGSKGRLQVESDYSISAWADTFVSSVTGASRLSSGSTWKLDRPAATGVSAGLEPHAARVKALSSLNSIGPR